MEELDGEVLTFAEDELNFHVDDEMIAGADEEPHDFQPKADYDLSPPARFVAQPARLRLVLTSMSQYIIAWSCQLGLSEALEGIQQQPGPSKLHKRDFLYQLAPSIPLGSDELHLEGCTQPHASSPHQPQLSESVLLMFALLG